MTPQIMKKRTTWNYECKKVKWIVIIRKNRGKKGKKNGEKSHIVPLNYVYDWQKYVLKINNNNNKNIKQNAISNEKFTNCKTNTLIITYKNKIRTYVW